MTRTRVARERAEYPNKLDYSGAGLRSNNMLAICVNTLDTQSRDTFENKQSSLCVYLCVCVVCVWCASLFDCLSVQLSACWSLQHWFVNIIQYTNTLQPAAWSSGMILASGASGLGFNSRNSPSMIKRTIMLAALGNRFPGCTLKTYDRMKHTFRVMGQRLPCAIAGWGHHKLQNCIDERCV